jgi:hypothetical protein
MGKRSFFKLIQKKRSYLPTFRVGTGFIRPFITRKALLRKKRAVDWESIVGRIKGFDQESLLTWVSQISLDVMRAELGERAIARLSDFFQNLQSSDWNPQENISIYWLIKEYPANHFFHVQLMNFVTTVIVRFGVINTAPAFDAEKQPEEFLKIILELTDYIEPLEDGVTEEESDDFIAGILRSSRFFNLYFPIANRIVSQHQILKEMEEDPRFVNDILPISEKAFGKGVTPRSYFQHFLIPLLATFLDPNCTPAIKPDHFGLTKLDQMEASKMLEENISREESFSAALIPARRPVAHAACRLNPPV